MKEFYQGDYLLKGQLPWQNLQYIDEEDKMRQVGQMKMKMDMNELCKGILFAFGRFLDYIKALPFKAEPNYKYCQSLFKKLTQEHNYQQKDIIFDWDQSQKSDRLDDKKQQKIESYMPHSSNNSNIINNKPSLFSKDDISSNNIGGSLLNYSQEQLEMNSLLKTPEQRKSSLAQDINRRKCRMQSVSSFNDSHSEIDYKWQCYGQANFHSILIQEAKQIKVNLTPEQKRSNLQEKKLSIVPNLYIQQITGQKQKILQRNSNSQQKFSNKKEEETIKEFSKMNESG